MKTFALLIPTLVLFSSCSVFCPKPSPVKPEIRYVEKKVYYSTGLNSKARAELSKAKAVADAAQREANEANDLVKLMAESGSPFGGAVNDLVSGYQGKILALKAHIAETDLILAELGVNLAEATALIQETKKQMAASEDEKAALRGQLAHAQDKAAAYKKKYEALKKYRYIILGLGLWMVIKVLGALGAWTPQGRLARTLIG